MTSARGSGPLSGARAAPAWPASGKHITDGLTVPTAKGQLE